MAIDLIISGYCSLDHIIKTHAKPIIGKTAVIINNNYANNYYGGCSVNVAYHLAKLNLNVSPIIRVGKDYESSGFKSYLEEIGINMQGIEKIPNSNTSSTFIIEDPNHNHITLFYEGAMAKEYIKPYKNSWFSQAKCALMTVASLEDNKEFLKKVKKYNIPLFLGMKMDSNAFPKELLKEFLQEVKVFFVNEDEASCILDIYKLNNIYDLFEILPKLEVVVITKGENGSKAVYKDNNIKEISIGIIHSTNVVDTVGAGDAYIAGYIYGYLTKKDIKTSMQYGATLASFIVESPGCTTNSPTKEMLMKRYLNHFSKEK